MHMQDPKYAMPHAQVSILLSSHYDQFESFICLDEFIVPSRSKCDLKTCCSWGALNVADIMCTHNHGAVYTEGVDIPRTSKPHWQGLAPRLRGGYSICWQHREDANTCSILGQGIALDHALRCSHVIKIIIRLNYQRLPT